MANFKIGEKVVFIGPLRKPLFEGFAFPKHNEIVTIHSVCEVCIDHYNVSEYFNDKNGNPQCFKSDNFRKLDYEFAENLLAEISEAMTSEAVLN